MAGVFLPMFVEDGSRFWRGTLRYGETAPHVGRTALMGVTTYTDRFLERKVSRLLSI